MPRYEPFNLGGVYVGNPRPSVDWANGGHITVSDGAYAYPTVADLPPRWVVNSYEYEREEALEVVVRNALGRRAQRAADRLEQSLAALRNYANRADTLRRAVEPGLVTILSLPHNRKPKMLWRWWEDDELPYAIGRLGEFAGVNTYSYRRVQTSRIRYATEDALARGAP